MGKIYIEKPVHTIMWREQAFCMGLYCDAGIQTAGGRPWSSARISTGYGQNIDRIRPEILAEYSQNMVRATSEYHLHQQHVAYRSQRDAGKGIALPEVEPHHHGNGYELRQAIGAG